MSDALATGRPLEGTEAHTENPSRRRLFGTLLAAASGAVAAFLAPALTRFGIAPLLLGRGPKRFGVDIGPAADFAATAGLAALSTTCTHLGCGVAWSAERKAFLCPCHGGAYGEDGAVVAGPPPRSLERLTVAVDGSRLRVLPSERAS